MNQCDFVPCNHNVARAMASCRVLRIVRERLRLLVIARLGVARRVARLAAGAAIHNTPVRVVNQLKLMA